VRGRRTRARRRPAGDGRRRGQRPRGPPGGSQDPGPGGRMIGSDPVRVGSVVIDCLDLELMTRFWSDALGYRPDESGRTERWCRLDDPAGRVNVSLQVVQDPTPGKNKLHLDLYTANQAAEAGTPR